MNAGHDSDKILDHTRQQLSALVDGELAPDEAAFLMRRLQHDEELAGCWERWQLAGAVLRGQGGLRVPDTFSAGVMAAVAREAAPVPAARPRRWLHWSGGALAASVALVALFLSRPAGPPERSSEPASAPVLAQAPARPAPVVPASSAPAPTTPDMTAQLATAVAVADVPRRAAHARRAGSGQAQRAATRAREERVAQAPVVVVASGGDLNAATVPAGNPFSTRHALPASRPWPRAVVPGMPASGAFTVDYGGSAPQSPGFYPFEPARLQPQRSEPLPDAP